MVALILIPTLIASLAVATPPPPHASHGAMTVEVTHASAVIWSRADRAAMMHVRMAPASRDGAAKVQHVRVTEEDDFTGSVFFRGLRPDTEYRYAVWFTPGDHPPPDLPGVASVEGTFKTAPARADPVPVKIVWDGDFAGQNVCRDAVEGFPILNAINQEEADLFIGLGDMIYADNLCEEIGLYNNPQVVGDFTESADLENFWAHWRYARADSGFRTLFSRTPYYAVWDDHEVVNDFGPLADTRSEPPYTDGEHLLPIGLQAFLDYNPMSPRRKAPRLYRNVRWGGHVELFLLDNRQYRDANLGSDREDDPKTMLGRPQLRWLQKSLKRSEATWKVIVSSVPISIPTGSPPNLGRDGWANFDANTDPTIEGIAQSETGFEQELFAILQTLRDHDANAVFITTDVHFGEVFRYTPFPNTPEFQVHEVVVGPGNAGIFPNRAFDTTLGTESLFFHGPERFAEVTSWTEAKRWFNYGVLTVDDAGRLTMQMKDTAGTVLFEKTLKPSSR